LWDAAGALTKLLDWLLLFDEVELARPERIYSPSRRVVAIDLLGFCM
jgi:hypothetical protein